MPFYFIAYNSCWKVVIIGNGKSEKLQQFWSYFENPDALLSTWNLYM